MLQFFNERKRVHSEVEVLEMKIQNSLHFIIIVSFTDGKIPF
jgi:hypothetical protein